MNASPSASTLEPPAADAPAAAPAPAPLADPQSAPSVSRAYECQCGRPVYLRNSRCLACGTALGYVIERLGVVPLTPGAEPDTWAVHDDPQGPAWRRCANFESAAGCNWMVPLPQGQGGTGDHADDLGEGLCLACSTTRTIPDLSVPGNDELWRKLESAKRRLLSQLLALGLPVHTRFTDPVHGMSFDFLSSMPGQSHVMTGHQSGVITLNAEEAEDAVRERIRAEMREPYRTLLGHFRHEIGHYYWDLLIPGTPWQEGFRALFGDETQDYGVALQTHYDNGPPPDWALRFVTSYASTHPWEDWAETWAHYLHMADTVDTALSFGVNAANVELSRDLFELKDLWQPEHEGAPAFLDFLNGWVRLTSVLNELSRSMGQPDYYPFVLPHAAVGKLQFIHQLVAAQRGGTAAAPDVEAAAPQQQGPSGEAVAAAA
ncbi:putative zinc-binding metallopeptidase [Xenophilus arseniciresistens]|uniref:Zinc-binding metallopeptidase n=1 Tax=Xenophilus arseniciresistens TaxID=1283306 RepID=A0AAE3T250_9BURK|nr:putative zinc-binding metallopeptidase [Xenophilus arseniciresistens]MDA7418686.1 putative zinc-binding metallopeptidase [Xenophilus arseniciresistens]